MEALEPDRHERFREPTNVSGLMRPNPLPDQRPCSDPISGRLNAWIGIIIVVQNVVSSLVNSHLFDFTQGWLDVFAVGVAGGMALRERSSTTAAKLGARFASSQTLLG